MEPWSGAREVQEEPKRPPSKEYAPGMLCSPSAPGPGRPLVPSCLLCILLSLTSVLELIKKQRGLSGPPDLPAS